MERDQRPAVARALQRHHHSVAGHLRQRPAGPSGSQQVTIATGREWSTLRIIGPVAALPHGPIEGPALDRSLSSVLAPTVAARTCRQPPPRQAMAPAASGASAAAPGLRRRDSARRDHDVAHRAIAARPADRSRPPCRSPTPRGSSPTASPRLATPRDRDKHVGPRVRRTATTCAATRPKPGSLEDTA